MAPRMKTVLYASVALFPLLVATQSSSNNPQVVGQNYSQFDLFKNTGLSPCPINSGHSKRSNLEPRRRGGGGGGGGGGTSYVNVSAFFVSTASVKDQSSFCNIVANGNTTIMIPTYPTQTAFFPGWPTYLIQLISLSISYAGLWWTYRKLNKTGNVETKLPITFWIQLPFDIAREIAWFFKAIHGFINSTRFAWVSNVLWLLPLTYIWLIQLLRVKKFKLENQQYNLQQTWDQQYNPEQTWDQQYNPQQTQSYPPQQQNGKSAQYSAVATTEYAAQYPPQTSGSLTSPRKNLIITILTVIVALIAIVQWFLTVFSVKKHLLNIRTNYSVLHTYIESPHAFTDPSSIAPKMPASCLAWLQSSDGKAWIPELFKRGFGESNVFTASVLQFGACTLAFLVQLWKTFGASCWSRIRRRGNESSLAPKRPSRTWGMIRTAAGTTVVTLAVSAIIVGVWTSALTKGSYIDFAYTTNSTRTGGCTFAYAPMSKKWGYLDVQQELPFRLVMSILGAS